jgi:hypothetical protein
MLKVEIPERTIPEIDWNAQQRTRRTTPEQRTSDVRFDFSALALPHGGVEELSVQVEFSRDRRILQQFCESLNQIKNDTPCHGTNNPNKRPHLHGVIVRDSGPSVRNAEKCQPPIPNP